MANETSVTSAETTNSVTKEVVETEGNAGDNANTETKDTKADTTGDAGADKAKADESAKAAAALKELTASYEKVQFKLPKELGIKPESFGEAKKMFAELGIKPDAAQKLVDWFTGNESGRLKAIAEGITKERQANEKALKSDKELIGDDGKQLAGTMQLARNAMKKLATPELRKKLEAAGLDADVEVIRLFRRVGELVSEDSVKGSKSTSKTIERSRSESLQTRYPNTPELWK